MSVDTQPYGQTLESSERTLQIEKIFERVEAECARRAEEEAVVEQERVEAQEEAERSQMQAEASDDVPSPVSPNATITAAATRQRRRGSVSVSRFGMPTDSCPEPVSIGTPLSPSTRPSRSSSIVIHPPKMYNVQSNHGSADSLASEQEDPSLQVEEQTNSATMAKITGKQSISKAISQRLSRTRSRDVLKSANNSVIIGVAVQEATVETHEEDGEDTPQATVVSTVQAPEGLKKQRSTPKLEGSQSSSWMAKAKELTSRFKRKSMAALSQVS